MSHRPDISVTVSDLTLRFPVYGVDAKSLKKYLAKITVGGQLRSNLTGSTIVTALNKVNFALGPGDRLGLIGHNGSGKTSLLRALSGAYEPDEGTIDVHGRISALLDLSLGIDPSATGLDNIRLRGRIAGLSARQIESRMEEIVAFSGLGAYIAMPLKTYSAGMQARLAFAVATSVEADVLLMDEWVAVGDGDFRALAEQRLNELVERAGILVLASHDLALIERYCNKVIRIESGRASAVTPIGELGGLLAAA
ncbi:MAG: sugar ABC transporter ATP-binding protein [Phenylobacterium sp.]|uniref:ABC transporter ATP-binding protein n=1 Tax=Phenylobacterium sp. TaxID=1871053 RepID=UPI0025EB902C|nr:ABC transporter ATP-binding protein [Phenylobacterium sp.]MBA4010697.1 sugar ABC transporter ATP-binding protein [Phenylobacterium sp.]